MATSRMGMVTGLVLSSSTARAANAFVVWDRVHAAKPAVVKKVKARLSTTNTTDLEGLP